jgi:hypothetical protein
MKGALAGALVTKGREELCDRPQTETGRSARVLRRVLHRWRRRPSRRREFLLVGFLAILSSADNEVDKPRDEKYATEDTESDARLGSGGHALLDLSIRVTGRRLSWYAEWFRNSRSTLPDNLITRHRCVASGFVNLGNCSNDIGLCRRIDDRGNARVIVIAIALLVFMGYRARGHTGAVDDIANYINQLPPGMGVSMGHWHCVETGRRKVFVTEGGWASKLVMR